MKQLRNILGYFLGFVLFVGLMPTLMWLASGRPAFWSEVATKDVVAWGLMLCGLLLSIWTIVYMKRRGKGNPMDAFGHEVAPRTQHLMTDGPYRLNRNPMLTGTLVYLIGFAPVAIFLAGCHRLAPFLCHHVYPGTQRRASLTS